MRNIKYVQSRFVRCNGKKLSGRSDSQGIDGSMVDSTS